MIRVVVVAEPVELKLIPLAYKNCPVLITGVGAQADASLELLDDEYVDEIVNFGYCAASKEILIGTTIEMTGDNCYTADSFVTSEDELPEHFDPVTDVVDMEWARLNEFCAARNIRLKSYKTVSDHFNYQTYKKGVG